MSDWGELLGLQKIWQSKDTVKLWTKRGYYLPRNQTPPVFPGCWGFVRMGYHALLEQRTVCGNQINLGMAERLMLLLMQSSCSASPVQKPGASCGGDFVFLYSRSHSNYVANAGMETWRNPFQGQVTREAPGNKPKQHSVCGLRGKTDQ